jgi:hypothetical protein
MIRVWWRSRAGLLLIGFLLLDAAIWAYIETAGARLNAGTDVTVQQFLWTALGVFLVWRAWRGSRIAWGALLVINVAVLALLLLGLTRSWNAYASGLWVLVIAQTLILLAPAVRRHLRQGHQVHY